MTITIQMTVIMISYFDYRHAPQRKLNLKEKKVSQKPWITNDLLKKIKHRDKLFAQKRTIQVILT